MKDFLEMCIEPLFWTLIATVFGVVLIAILGIEMALAASILGTLTVLFGYMLWAL